MSFGLLKLFILLDFFIFTYAGRIPMLIVSLDGMRADKLEQHLAKNPSSNFFRMIDNGVKADFMKPSFPSATFPNHWTLVTGLYPESHGLIANVAYDPKIGAKARFGTTNDPSWWNHTDPIWLTAKRQGLKTGSSFWIGNNVLNRKPDIYLEYIQNYYNPRARIDEMIDWMNKFKLDFCTLYFDEPDLTGHKYGPDGPEYMNKIAEMDSIIGYLLDSLEKNKILNNLNLVMVSDHGMAKLGKDQYVVMQNYLDIKLVDTDKSVFSEVSNVYPSSPDKLDILYQSMQSLPNIKTYYKGKVPAEFNYNNNDRIAPLVAVANIGYELTINASAPTQEGSHGFNNSLPQMRAIFMARGPNFKPGSKLGSFENVNVYPLMCKLMDIKCHDSNGTAKTFDSVYQEVNDEWSIFTEIYQYLMSWFKNQN